MAPIKLLYRNEWSAMPPKWTTEILLPVGHLFFGPTNKGKCYTVRGCIKELQYLQRRHMSRPGSPDIKYNFVIGCDGIVLEGRGWFTSPGLPMEYSNLNKVSLFFGLTGSYCGKYEPLPPAMKNAMDKLIQMGIDHKYIDPSYIAYDL